MIVTISMHAHIAAARAEADLSSSPAESHEQAIPDPVRQGRGWDRLGVGIHVGLSLAQIIGSDAPSEVVEHTDKPDVTLGIHGRVGFSEWLSLHPELMFVSKGRRDNHDGMLLGTLELDYFEVPLLARITIPIDQRVAPYLFGGPALGVLLRFQVTNEADGSVTDRTDQAKRIDVSGVLGAGVQVALTPRHGLTLEARYDRSFTRILENGDQ